MSVKPLSEEQISLLAANPNVRKATPKYIQVSDRFKLEFIERYEEGIYPIQIFRDAGFGLDSIGRLRFERACANWLHKRGAGKGATPDKRWRPLSRAPGMGDRPWPSGSGRRPSHRRNRPAHRHPARRCRSRAMLKRRCRSWHASLYVQRRHHGCFSDFAKLRSYPGVAPHAKRARDMPRPQISPRL